MANDRALLSRILLLLTTLLICFGLAELLLRAFAAPAVLRGLHEARPERPWLYRLAPGTRATTEDGISYAINADGFRDMLYSRPKPDGTFRVIVLGDSVTFGFGVDAEGSLPKRLEALLGDAAPQTPIEVLNFGVNGYSPYNQAAQLAEFGASYEPDLILVQFCINDLNDPTLHFAASAQLEMGVLPLDAYPDPSMRREVSWIELTCRRSALCDRVLSWRIGGAAAPRDERARSAAYRPRSDARYKAEWSWLETRYAEIADVAAGIGAGFAVVEVPYRDQLREPRDATSTLLRRIGERRGWPTVSAVDAFREASTSGRDSTGTLFMDLWHPSAHGHDVFSRALARQLRCSGLLPADAQLAVSECS